MSNLAIKYPLGIEPLLMQHRKLVNRYTTNRMLRIYGSYCILKAHTTSGVIQDWHGQQKLLLQLLKCTRNTLPVLIADLVKNNLVTVNDGSIILNNWIDTSAALGLTDELQFQQVNIDLTDRNQTPQYLFYTTEIAANQLKQIGALQKRISKTPGLKSEISDAISQVLPYSITELQLLSFSKFLEVWLQAQVIAFGSGATCLPVLHCLRPDINRTLRSLTVAWRMKDGRTAAYVKRKLKQLGMASITHREPVLAASKEVRARKLCKEYADGFNKATQLPVWYMADQIKITIGIN